MLSLNVAFGIISLEGFAAQVLDTAIPAEESSDRWEFLLTRPLLPLGFPRSLTLGKLSPTEFYSFWSLSLLCVYALAPNSRFWLLHQDTLANTDH